MVVGTSAQQADWILHLLQRGRGRTFGQVAEEMHKAMLDRYGRRLRLGATARSAELRLAQVEGSQWQPQPAAGGADARRAPLLDDELVAAVSCGLTLTDGWTEQSSAGVTALRHAAQLGDARFVMQQAQVLGVLHNCRCWLPAACRPAPLCLLPCPCLRWALADTKRCPAAALTWL